MAGIVVRGLSVHYGERLALQDVTMDIEPREVTALIGPSGCGKSTFLRCLNRMNDTIPGARARGTVAIDGRNIYAPGMDVVKLRMTRFPRRSTTTWPSAPGYGGPTGGGGWTSWWRGACAPPTSGTR